MSPTRCTTADGMVSTKPLPSCVRPSPTTGEISISRATVPATGCRIVRLSAKKAL
jgi:hypothetical protein